MLLQKYCSSILLFMQLLLTGAADQAAAAVIRLLLPQLTQPADARTAAESYAAHYIEKRNPSRTAYKIIYRCGAILPSPMPWTL